MKTLTRILLIYSSKLPILDYLAAAFGRAGIVTGRVYADKNTRFDRWIIHPINKQLHNFRIIPKSRNLFADHPLAHQNFRSSALAAKVAEFNPDLVFFVRGIGFNRNVLKDISPLFGWWIEGEDRFAEAFHEADLFDWYFFLSRSWVNLARDRGISHVSYLAHTVDPSVFYPIAHCTKRHDICFVGNWTPKRQSFIEAALTVTPNIAIYGGKWLKKNLFHPAVRCCIRGGRYGGTI